MLKKLIKKNVKSIQGAAKSVAKRAGSNLKSLTKAGSKSRSAVASAAKAGGVAPMAAAAMKGKDKARGAAPLAVAAMKSKKRETKNMSMKQLDAARASSGFMGSIPSAILYDEDEGREGKA